MKTCSCLILIWAVCFMTACNRDEPSSQGETTTLPVAISPEEPVIGMVDPASASLTSPGLDLKQRYVKEQSESGKLEIIAEAETSRSPELVEFLRQALRHTDKEFRLAALESASMLEGPEALEIITGAVHDSSPEVRHAALEQAVELADGDRLTAMREALKNPHLDVRETAARELANEMSKPAFAILLEALFDGEPSVRSLAEDQVDFHLTGIVEKTFNSSGAALAWWNKNQDLFDQTMNYIGGQNLAP